MAFDAFLHLDGIKGESKDSKHAESIEIESFSWGASVPTGSTGTATGRASLQDFTFTADTSSASPQLFAHLTLNKHIKEGIITVRNKAGAQPNDYYVVKLSDLIISSYSQAGSVGGERPVDQFSLNYASIHISYTEVDDNGNEGATYEAEYDRIIKA